MREEVIQGGPPKLSHLQYIQCDNFSGRPCRGRRLLREEVIEGGGYRGRKLLREEFIEVEFIEGGSY